MKKSGYREGSIRHFYQSQYANEYHRLKTELIRIRRAATLEASSEYRREVAELDVKYQKLLQQRAADLQPLKDLVAHLEKTFAQVNEKKSYQKILQERKVLHDLARSREVQTESVHHTSVLKMGASIVPGPQGALFSLLMNFYNPTRDYDLRKQPELNKDSFLAEFNLLNKDIEKAIKMYSFTNKVKMRKWHAFMITPGPDGRTVGHVSIDTHDEKGDSIAKKYVSFYNPENPTWQTIYNLRSDYPGNIDAHGRNVNLEIDLQLDRPPKQRSPFIEINLFCLDMESLNKLISAYHANEKPHYSLDAHHALLEQLGIRAPSQDHHCCSLIDKMLFDSGLYRFIEKDRKPLNLKEKVCETGFSWLASLANSPVYRASFFLPGSLSTFATIYAATTSGIDALQTANQAEKFILNPDYIETICLVAEYKQLIELENLVDRVNYFCDGHMKELAAEYEKERNLLDQKWVKPCANFVSNRLYNDTAYNDCCRKMWDIIMSIYGYVNNHSDLPYIEKEKFLENIRAAGALTSVKEVCDNAKWFLSSYVVNSWLLPKSYQNVTRDIAKKCSQVSAIVNIFIDNFSYLATFERRIASLCDSEERASPRYSNRY